MEGSTAAGAATTDGRLAQIAFIGVGRMGGRMATRLLAAGHPVTTYDPSPEATAAREAIQQTRTTEDAPDETERPDPDADARHDDLDAEDAGLAGAELIQRELGGTIINEIRHD